MYNNVFYNTDGYHFYDYRLWYIHGNDTLLNDIIEAMEYDIHKAYTKYETSDIAVLKTLGKSGRFKDATLLESFKKTTKKDILDFIYYSSFYASSYYGINSLIVKYADWVLLNCPVSYGEFLKPQKMPPPILNSKKLRSFIKQKYWRTICLPTWVMMKNRWLKTDELNWLLQ